MAHSLHPRRLFLCLLPLQLLLFFAAWHALAKKKHRSLLVNDAKPAEESAFDRGIVTEHLNYKSVLFVRCVPFPQQPALPFLLLLSFSL